VIESHDLHQTSSFCLDVKISGKDWIHLQTNPLPLVGSSAARAIKVDLMYDGLSGGQLVAALMILILLVGTVLLMLQRAHRRADLPLPRPGPAHDADRQRVVAELRARSSTDPLPRASEPEPASPETSADDVEQSAVEPSRSLVSGRAS
jgi:hypothetical protein